MNPRKNYGAFICEREERLEDLSMGELASKLEFITHKQNCIRGFGLSDEITSLAIKELEEQKTEIRRALHKLVDKL